MAGYRLDTDRPRLIVTFLPGQLSTTWAGHVLCSYSTDGPTLEIIKVSFVFGHERDRETERQRDICGRHGPLCKG